MEDSQLSSPSPAPSDSSARFSDVSSTTADSSSSQRNTPNPTKSKVGMDSSITLWQFLLELLLSSQHQDKIRWTNNEGEFKLINAEEVARLWGLRKNKHNMNYDKLSRALRYYYDKSIIKKVMGQKFVYKFVSFPEVIKTENKIPFKAKMESMAQQYGQGVLTFSTPFYRPFEPLTSYVPHSSPSVPSSDSFRQLQARVSLSSSMSSTCSVTVAQPKSIPQQSIKQSSPSPSVSPSPHAAETTTIASTRSTTPHRIPTFTYVKPDRIKCDPAQQTIVSSVHSSTIPTFSRPSLVRPFDGQSESEHSPAKKARVSEPSRRLSTPGRPNSLASSTHTIFADSKRKPNVLSLGSKEFIPDYPLTTPLPMLSPTVKIPPTPFAGIPTPLMLSSPMLGQRTPLLTFWSSFPLSPVAAAAMSPHYAVSTTASAFQFPTYISGQMALSPITMPTAFSNFENMPSPTKPIPVL